jgi:replicative DNA helicase
MLAHLLGDGCVVKRQPVHYTSADTANLEAVEEAATHFGIKPRRVQQGNWWHVYLPAPFALGRGKRNPIAAWLDSFGLYGCHSWEKFLPSEVFSLPQEQIALFLRHLWATDGCLHVRTNQHEQEIVSIYYSTTSQRLAHDLQLILLRFGIQARLHKVGQGKYRPSFHVVVSGAENQLRFLKEIGVHGERGENVDRAVKTLVGQVGNPNVDTIPWEIRTFVVEAMGRVGMSQRSLASAIGEQYAGSYMLGSPSRPRSSSRERMATIARAVDDSALLALAQSDVSWDTVVAIEPMGEQPVFDATVLGTHNFLANNIVAHNSIEQDADVVVFIYRDVKYNPETERPHVADIIVAKHRNGPTGTVHLFFQDSLMRFLDLSIRDDAG